MRAGFTPIRQGRPAFTLVELLVVISIIAILVALGAGVYWASLRSANVTTAKTLLRAGQSVVDKQWASVTSKARSDPLGGFANSGNPDQARANYVSTVQQHAFPTTFAAVQSLVPPSPQQSVYGTYFQGYGLLTYNMQQPVVPSITSSNPPVNSAAALESSICLVMALQRSQGGMATVPEDLKASIKQFTINGGTQSVPALVDPWGQPIQFSYQTTTVSGQNQLTPLLTSAGPDRTFGTSDDLLGK